MWLQAAPAWQASACRILAGHGAHTIQSTACIHLQWSRPLLASSQGCRSGLCGSLIYASMTKRIKVVVWLLNVTNHRVTP